MALVTIAEFADGIGAGLARDRLAAEGIPAILFDGGMASLGLGHMTPARLMVDEDDRSAAEAALADL